MKVQPKENKAIANINKNKIIIKLNNKKNKKISINEKQFKVNVIDNKVNVSLGVKRIYPELEDLEVTPTKEKQQFKSNKYGYDNVTVKGIETENLNITPSEEEQNFNGLFERVNVNPIPDEYIIPKVIERTLLLTRVNIDEGRLIL